MKKIKKLVAVIILLSLVASLSSNFYVVKASSFEIQETSRSFEETSKLPNANIKQDGMTGLQKIETKSNSPKSIKEYKKLGYKNFRYSRWTGYKNAASTRSKRIAGYVATSVLSFVPSKLVQASLFLYGLSEAVQKQNPDIWPSVNARNIIAKSPRGYDVIIAQETEVKYYGNSARTKLIKTIEKTFWR